MEHVAELKGLSNEKTGQKYFIGEQIPEGVTEIRKQTNARAKMLKDKNEKKPKDQRQKITVINDKILVDGDKEIQPPQSSDLLFLTKSKQEEVDDIQAKIIEAEPERIKNSEFIALAVKVHSVEQVNLAYLAVAQRYPEADHIVLGYAMKEQGQLKSGSCDDREFGAGEHIRKTIFEQKARNTAVFVVRKFGGIHMGYSRFGVF